MRISLGYPAPQAERQLLQGLSGRAALDQLNSSLNAEQLQHLQASAGQIRVSDILLDYVQRLIAASRDGSICSLGLSPRAALALMDSARSWALLHGREHVVPEDIQAVFSAVCGHRLQGREETDGEVLARRLLSSVDVVG